MRVNDKFATPAPPGDPVNLLATPGSISRNRSSRTPGIKKEEAHDGRELGVDEGDVDGSLEVRITKEEQIKHYLETWIYPEWKRLLAKRQSEPERSTPPGLERFESGKIFINKKSKG